MHTAFKTETLSQSRTVCSNAYLQQKMLISKMSLRGFFRNSLNPVEDVMFLLPFHAGLCSIYQLTMSSELRRKERNNVLSL